MSLANRPGNLSKNIIVIPIKQYYRHVTFLIAVWYFSSAEVAKDFQIDVYSPSSCHERGTVEAAQLRERQGILPLVFFFLDSSFHLTKTLQPASGTAIHFRVTGDVNFQGRFSCCWIR